METTDNASITSKELTLDEIIEAVENINVLPRYVEVRMCKKHWDILYKRFKDRKFERPVFRLFGIGLFGIPVYIKPYLKKIRVYSEGKL